MFAVAKYAEDTTRELTPREAADAEDDRYFALSVEERQVEIDRALDEYEPIFKREQAEWSRQYAPKRRCCCACS